MESKISPIKEKADLLKGNLGYKEHYDYLMDWYLNDRKIRVPQAEVHESLKDVLEALKELNAKVDSGYAKPRQRTGLFTKLLERQNA